MKVICVDDSVMPNRFFDRAWRVKEGCIYTVTFEGLGQLTDGTKINIYSLKEDPDNETHGWEKWRFIPISSIDETEFVRNYNTETA